MSADILVPMVATADIGEVVARALRSPAPVSEAVDLIGPACTERKVAGMLGTALGRNLRVAAIPEEAWPQVLSDTGFPVHVAESLTELYRVDAHGLLAPRDDRSSRVSTTIDTTINRLLTA
ncbi:MAG: hypothetical protein ACK5LO_02935 [Leucobacter sp.]